MSAGKRLGGGDVAADAAARRSVRQGQQAAEAAAQADGQEVPVAFSNFPACVKAVAEWFPKRQRSLATGIFSTGTNFGAMLQGAIMFLAVAWSWSR